MHIPDGFLDLKTVAVTGLCAACGLGWALSKAHKELPQRKVPLLGLGAAFLFSAQMINFPVMMGVSGHLIGSALLAVLLGVPAAVIVVTSVLIAQAFLFADGGVTALGANVFNLGVVAPLAGSLAYRLVTLLVKDERGRIAGVAFGAWCSTIAASLACAGQLAWSGTVAWGVGLPAMVGIHVLIGLGEAVISALAYFAITRARPSLVEGSTGQDGQGTVLQGVLACLGIALFVAPFACPWPDGLETVAARLGFEHQAQDNHLSVWGDYRLPGIENPGLATALAGGLGCLLALGLALLLGQALVRRTRPESGS